MHSWVPLAQAPSVETPKKVNSTESRGLWRWAKSSQGLLEAFAEAVGQTGAQRLVRGCGPHCPRSLEMTRREIRGEAARASLGL